MPPRKLDIESVNLPMRAFFYTLDQIADMLSIKLDTLKNTKIYFAGRSTGVKHPTHMNAVDMSAPRDTPDWRVSEQEFIAFCRYYKIQVYDKTWAR